MLGTESDGALRNPVTNQYIKVTRFKSIIYLYVVQAGIVSLPVERILSYSAAQLHSFHVKIHNYKQHAQPGSRSSARECSALSAGTHASDHKD